MAYRCLNGVSVKPIYTFGARVLFVSTVALYTILLVRHLPLNGHCSGFTAVTALRLAVVLPLHSTYSGVVSLDNSSHIGHATVADLNRVHIKHFM